MTKQQPSFEGDLTKVEEKLGAGFIANLTAAMGTEAAFALNGFSASGPTWMMVAPGEQPGGHRQLALEVRGHVQRRARSRTSRTSESISGRRARADGSGTP